MGTPTPAYVSHSKEVNNGAVVKIQNRLVGTPEGRQRHMLHVITTSNSSDPHESHGVHRILGSGLLRRFRATRPLMKWGGSRCFMGLSIFLLSLAFCSFAAGHLHLAACSSRLLLSIVREAGHWQPVDGWLGHRKSMLSRHLADLAHLSIEQAPIAAMPLQQWL